MPWLNAALAATLLASPAAAMAAQPPSAQSAPVQAAQAWLSIVDHGHYAQSWRRAGALFRTGVSAVEWGRKVSKARAPLGGVISRHFAGGQFSASLPAAPDGSYDQVSFDAQFTHKRAAVETVVLAHEPDGWRADGYFIR